MSKNCPSRTDSTALVLSLFLFCCAVCFAAQVPTGAEHAAKAAQLVQARDLKSAEAEMRQAVELTPKDPLYLARLGLILGMQNKPEEAIACFENALKLDPDDVAIRRDLAASQWQIGQNSAATENLEIILKAGRTDPQTLLLLAMVYISAKRYAPALAAAEQASEALPSSYKTYAVKGMAELRLHRYMDSEKSYQRAAELNPNAAEVNLGLALSQWTAGHVQQAFATFEVGLKKFPNDAYHYQEYGRLLLKSAKPNDLAAQTRSAALWQNAILLNSSLPEPHYMLGDLALQKGNAQEAVQQLEQAVKLDPNESKIHFALYRAYRRRGRSEDAARELQAFQKLKAQEETTPPVPLLTGGSD